MTVRRACIRRNKIRDINVRLGDIVHRVREQELHRKGNHLEYLLVCMACSTNDVQILIGNLAAPLDQRLRRANGNCSLRVA